MWDFVFLNDKHLFKYLQKVVENKRTFGSLAQIHV